MSHDPRAIIFAIIVGPPLICLYKGIEYVSEKNDNGKIREASTSEKAIGGILITLGIILSIIVSSGFIFVNKDDSSSLKFFIFFAGLFSIISIYYGIDGLRNNKKVEGSFCITLGVILILNVLASFITLYFFTKDTKNTYKPKKKKIK